MEWREVLNHVSTSVAFHRKSVPSIHMRCRMTASLRASATVARRRPLARINFMAHDLSFDGLRDRVSNESAAE